MVTLVARVTVINKAGTDFAYMALLLLSVNKHRRSLQREALGMKWAGDGLEEAEELGSRGTLQQGASPQTLTVELRLEL